MLGDGESAPMLLSRGRSGFQGYMAHMARPQDRFEDPVDNSNLPFVPKLHHLKALTPGSNAPAQHAAEEGRWLRPALGACLYCSIDVAAVCTVLVTNRQTSRLLAVFHLLLICYFTLAFFLIHYGGCKHICDIMLCDIGLAAHHGSTSVVGNLSASKQYNFDMMYGTCLSIGP